MINNSQKRIIFDHAKRLGHPDAEGFLARIDLESNYNEDKEGKDGRIGLSQVDPKEAENLGIEDIKTIEGNTNAAVAIDLINFENADNSLSKMYADWRGYKKDKAEKYNKQIDAKRDDVQAELFNEPDEDNATDNQLAYSSNRLVDGEQLKSLFGVDDTTARPLFRDESTELILAIIELIDRV